MARHGSARHGLAWLSCFRYEGFQERFAVKVRCGSVRQAAVWCGRVRHDLVWLSCFRYEGFQERFVVKVRSGKVSRGRVRLGAVGHGVVFLTRGAVNEK